MADLDEEVLESLYMWVDKIPLSRSKRNIARDFSDGVLMAEVIKHFAPKLVDLHNFPTCNSADAKKKNWHLINMKLFKRFNFELSEEVIDRLIIAKTGTIEKVLLLLRAKLELQSCDDKQASYDIRPESERFTNGSAGDQPSSPHPRVKKTTSNQDLSTKTTPQKVVSSRTRSKPNRTANTMEHRRHPGSVTDSQEFVARSLYEENVQECFQLQETVDIMKAKIKRLENLLQLKEARILELQEKLSQVRENTVH